MKDVTIRNMTKFIMTAAIAVALGVGLPSLGSAAYLTGASPVAHLTLDQNGNLPENFTDSSGANDGVCGASCPTQVTASPLVGTAHQNFTGGGQINIADATNDLDFASGTLTISAWMYRPSAVGIPDDEVVTGRADGGGTGVKWWLGISSTGLPTFYTQTKIGIDTIISDIKGVTAINDDSWHNLVGVYDGTTSKLYVDGVLVAQESVTHGAFASAVNI
jgi:hypothetical protein